MGKWAESCHRIAIVQPDQFAALWASALEKGDVTAVQVHEWQLLRPGWDFLLGGLG
jgi:hypothetical protein